MLSVAGGKRIQQKEEEQKLGPRSRKQDCKGTAEWTMRVV
jgi:hypothetical protein